MTHVEDEPAHTRSLAPVAAGSLGRSVAGN